MRGGLVVVVALACVAPATAHAGRSFFGWLYPTEVMPERSVELQTWVSEENRTEDAANRSRSIWGVGPLIGITDQLELVLPLEVWWSKVPSMPGATSLNNYGVEARYRFAPHDPGEAPPLVPLLRVAVRRQVLARDVMRPEINLVTSYEAGRVFVAADVGLIADLTRDDQQLDARAGLGVSVLAVGELRFGAELFSQIAVEHPGDAGESWAVVGPNLSWTHGRFWVSATYGIGIYNIKDAPRMQWGIAF